MSLFHEKHVLYPHQSVIGNGTSYFIHNKDPDKYMETVLKLNHKTINDYVKGITDNDLEFYDRYRNIREVAVMGRGNSGKSSLLNSLNNNKKVAKVAK
jgi:GTP-binding protein EngB required for normal cell division